MAATTLFSPPHQPLAESHSANRMDMDPVINDRKTSKKRKSDVNGDSSKKKKRDSISTRHCHQCHQGREVYLECTYLTTRGKKTERCGKLFCQDCLKRRYDEDTSAILAAGRPKDPTKLLGHVQTESYVWRCPICKQNCNCAPHRKQYGLSPTGFLTAFAKEKGLTVAQLLQDPDAVEAVRLAKENKEPTPKKPKPLPKGAVLTGRAESEQKEADKEKGKEKKSVKLAAKPVEKKTTEKPAKPALEKDKVGKPKTVTIIPAAPKPFVKLPKHVSDPEFEFIEVSYPLGVIEKRLRIREFLLRFEKMMIKLPPKYFRTINDPNSEWSDLTYRNLITSLLPIIQADANQILNGDMVYEAVDSIKKVTADSPMVWVILKNLLGQTYSPSDLNFDCGEEDGKLGVIMRVVHLALQTTVIRNRIDEDQEKEKEKNKVAVAEVKRLKAEWEQTKGELQKERLLLKSGERAEWDDRYGKAFRTNKKLIARVEEKQWFSSRKTCTRTLPLGIDAKGNIYWMFTQRNKKDDGWGRWVIVQKNKDLPHPSGALPKPDGPGDIQDDLDISEVLERQDGGVARSRIWYAISGAQNVRQLGEWIKYQSDLVFFKKAMASSNGSSASLSPTNAAAAAPHTPKKKSEKVTVNTPSRQLMVEVRLPQRSFEKMDPVELVTKESTEALYSRLQKIASFLELNEEPEKLI